MKRKALIIVSTVAVFILTVIVAFVWLFRVRYIDVDVRYIDVDADADLYDYVEETLNENFLNKPSASVKESEIFTVFSSNPYVKVLEVSKVFPDRLKVVVKKRIEKYLVVCGERTYVADDEFVLLRVDEPAVSDAELIKIDVPAGHIISEDLTLGKKIVGSDKGLFDCAMAIYDGFSDKILISGAEITDDPSCITFDIKTGVNIKFYFEYATTEEKIAILERVSNVEKFFEGLSPEQKLKGSIHVIKGQDIRWDF